ncbi:MAG: TonB-dependent receptor plug domain-containing protein, partial [Opitutales bacterium]
MGGELVLIGKQEPEELPEIVSVARRVDMPRREVGGIISVITRDDLNRARQPFVLDALRRIPGLRVARTGGPGQSAKLYLRGAEPRQTVILVDGVSLRSPNDANGYVLGTLSTANV